MMDLKVPVEVLQLIENEESVKKFIAKELIKTVKSDVFQRNLNIQHNAKVLSEEVSWNAQFLT